MVFVYLSIGVILSALIAMANNDLNIKDVKAEAGLYALIAVFWPLVVGFIFIIAGTALIRTPKDPEKALDEIQLTIEERIDAWIKDKGENE